MISIGVRTARAYARILAVTELVRDINELKRRTVNVLLDEIRKCDSDVEKTSRHAAKLVKTKAVLTHSSSSIVTAALLRARPKKVFATESKRLREGITITLQLAKVGRNVTLISDAEAPSILHEVSLVIVGADSVLGGWSVINKVGTYPIALACEDRGVQFIVAAETAEFSKHKITLNRLAENHDPRELFPLRHPRIQVLNRYFDVTPARLVAAYVTELRNPQPLPSKQNSST